MKKTLLLIAMTGALLLAVSCSNDDEPKRGDGVATVIYPMINHITKDGGNTVVGIFNTQNKLVLDTVNHKATLELNYNDGQGDKQLVLEDVVATPKRLGFYELSSPTYRSFKGYADFNEQSYRYNFTTTGGLHVISMTPEVFFYKTTTTVTYDDTTKASTTGDVIYQFNITPGTQKTTILVEKIVHTKDLKSFNYITARNVPITVTPTGFTISGTNLATEAEYVSFDFNTGHDAKKTDKYPFKTFNATIDLVNDHLDANFMMGGSATVVASGKTYTE